LAVQQFVFELPSAVLKFVALSIPTPAHVFGTSVWSKGVVWAWAMLHEKNTAEMKAHPATIVFRFQRFSGAQLESQSKERTRLNQPHRRHENM
jgi:hypothetical protein